MKPYQLAAFIIALITCSCQRTKKEKVYVQPSNVSKRDTIPWQQRLDLAKKDSSITGIVDVSKDTIVLLRYAIGMELSTDKGKTWTWLAKDRIRFNEFTTDNKGLWWGVDRWKGIHEKSYCRIYLSKDKGRSWKRYEFNTGVFFPYHIYSKPGTPLQVSEFDTEKVYELKGDDPTRGWSFVKQLPIQEYSYEDPSAGAYSISRQSVNNKLYVKRSNGSIDTLLNFTKANNIYYIEKIQNLIYVAGPSIGANESYFAVIKNERIFKEFTILGSIKLTISQFGRVYLTGSEGAYQYKNNELVKIF